MDAANNVIGIIFVVIFSLCGSSAFAYQMPVERYASMASAADTAQTAIVGDSLQINGKKVKIKGAPALPQPDGYNKLSDDQKDEIKRFCLNMRYPAGSAYLKIQTSKLDKLKKEVDARIAVLEDKTKEYQNWLNKRNQFLANTKAALINIISKMKPDVAAAELDKIDELSAASIIMKLKANSASSIMNNLSPEKAAAITEIMVSAQKIPVKKSSTITKTVPKDDNVPRPVADK